MSNSYYIGQSAAQLRVALSQDIPALYAAIAAAAAPAIPSASIGLAVVNGVATTYMRSDAAPPLSQAIAPTWTQAHTFSGNIVLASNIVGPSTASAYTIGANPNASVTTGGYMQLWGSTTGNAGLCVLGNINGALQITPAGTGAFSKGIGLNGVTAPAQSTGWGTPTGGSVSNNFAGATATLATLGPAMAQIIAIMKSVGFLGS